MEEYIDLILRGEEQVLKGIARVEAGLTNLTSDEFVIDSTESIIGFQELGRVAEQAFNNIVKFSTDAREAYLAFSEEVAEASTLSDDVAGLTSGFDEAARAAKNQSSEFELAAASYDILSASISDTESVTNLLTLSSKGAVAGLSDVGKISDGVTSSFNAYGDALSYMGNESERFEAIINQVLVTQNLGKITADEWAANISKVANSGAQAGVGIEELNAVVARATKTGITASTAFNGLAGILKGAIKPTQAAREEAEKLGIELGAASLRDGGLLKLFQEIEARSPDVATSLNNLFGNVRAANVAGAVLGNVEDYNNILQEITLSSGTLDEQFDKIANSSAGLQKQFDNLSADALKDIGAGLNLLFEPIIRGGILVLDLFDRLPQPIKTATGVAIGLSVALGAVVAGATSIVSILPAVSVATSAFTAAMAGNVVATNANTIALLANNAGLVIRQGLLAATATATKVVSVATALFTTNLNLAAAASGAFNAAMAAFKGGAIIAGIKAIPALVAGAASSFGALALAVGKVLLPIGLVAAGVASLISIIDTLSTRFGATEGGKAAREIEKVRLAVKDLREEELPTDKVEDYGRSWGFINFNTREQREAQRETIGLGKALEQVNNVVQDSQGVLNKYGVSQISAEDATRLGAEGIKAYGREADQQIETIDATIAALRDMELSSANNKKTVLTEINTLEKYKKTLQDNQTELINTGVEVNGLGEELLGLEDRVKRADAALKSANLKIEAEFSQAGDVSSSQAAETATALQERQTLEARIAARQEYNNELRNILATEQGATDEHREKLIASEAALNRDLAKQQSERAKLIEETARLSRQNAELQADINVARAVGRDEVFEAENERAEIVRSNLEQELQLQEKAGAESLKIARDRGATAEEVANITENNINKEKQLVLELAELERAEQERILAFKLESIDRTLKARQRERDFLASQSLAQVSEDSITSAGVEEARTILERQALEQRVADKTEAVKQLEALARKEGKDSEELAERIVASQTELNNELAALNQARIKQLETIARLERENLSLTAEIGVISATGDEERLKAEENLYKVKFANYNEEFKLIQQREAEAVKAAQDLGASEESLQELRLRYGNERLSLEKDIAELEASERERIAAIEKAANEERIALIKEENDLVTQGLESRATALESQVALNNALTGLSRERLGIAQTENQIAIQELELKKAGAKSDEEVARIEKDIIALKRGERIATLDFQAQEIQAKLASFAIETEILALREEQKRLSLEIALAEAQETGASEKRIALLQQQIQQQNAIAANAEKIRGIEQETLAAQLERIEANKQLETARFRTEDANADRGFIAPETFDIPNIERSEPTPSIVSQGDTYNNIFNVPDPIETGTQVINEQQRKARYLD